MNNNQLISITDYILDGSTVHEEHLNIIRDMYNQLINQLSVDNNDPDNPDDMVIAETARRLNIRNDTDEVQDCLRDCVRYKDINTTKIYIESKFNALEPMDEVVLEKQPVSSSTEPILRLRSLSSVTENETTLDKINCVLNIKISVPEVQTFIQSFLLQKVNKPENFITT